LPVKGQPGSSVNFQAHSSLKITSTYSDQVGVRGVFRRVWSCAQLCWNISGNVRSSWFFQLRDFDNEARIISDGKRLTSSPARIFIFLKRQRIGVFARLLEALHHSRRLQAQQLLREHCHLLVNSRDRLQTETGGDNNVDR
jgi:hypothetical protein